VLTGRGRRARSAAAAARAAQENGHAPPKGCGARRGARG